MTDLHDISRELLAKAIDQSRDGVTLADASQDHLPLVYVNAGFEHMTGYSAAELLGRDCSFLQGNDTDQPEIIELREALDQGNSCLITFRNYRKDGSMFWNQLSISPVHNDEGKLTHFIGLQQDVTSRILLDQHLRQSNLDLHTLNKQLYTLAHTDPLVGISNRLYFDNQLENELQTAQRTHSPLSVVMIDLDQFKLFNERYGRAAGDTCLRMVGERISKSYARASDCVARFEGNKFTVISMGTSIEDLQQHASKLCDQIRALNIPHSGSPLGVVTISAGCVTLIPFRDTTAQALLKQADTALRKAKKRGNDCEFVS